MGSYNFDKDLAKSISVEKKVGDFLLSRGATEMEFNHDKKYDILYKKGNNLYTLEVKEDQMYNKTGNVAIELKSRGKPSGICSSIADNWCYVLGNEFFFIRRDELILHLLTHKYRMVSGGDNNSSLLVLIPVADFRNICNVYGGLV